MVAGNAVHLREGAQRVCMEVLYFVLIMEGGRDVLCLTARKVLEVGRAFVFVMVGERGASMKGAGRVCRVVLIFARPMVEENFARGDNGSLVVKLPLLVTSLLGGKLAFVLLTVRLS